MFIERLVCGPIVFICLWSKLYFLEFVPLKDGRNSRIEIETSLIVKLVKNVFKKYVVQGVRKLLKVVYVNKTT